MGSSGINARIRKFDPTNNELKPVKIAEKSEENRKIRLNRMGINARIRKFDPSTELKHVKIGDMTEDWRKRELERRETELERRETELRHREQALDAERSARQDSQEQSEPNFAVSQFLNAIWKVMSDYVVVKDPTAPREFVSAIEV